MIFCVIQKSPSLSLWNEVILIRPLFHLVRKQVEILPSGFLSIRVNMCCTVTKGTLTVYNPGGRGDLKAPFRIFALTHLILELCYCTLRTFPKK